VIAAAGTFGYGTEMAQVIDIHRLGAIVCKGTTLKPRNGNPQPRLVETASGLLNSIGLDNIGVKAVVEDKAPIWAGWSVPVVVNITGEDIEEYAELARILEGVDGISGIEVNISCPNVEAGGMEFGTDPQAAAAVTAAVRRKTSLPIIVKLTPNVRDIVEIAQAVVRAGADALTLINAIKGMTIDIGRRKPILGTGSGGLSGPAIKPIALYMVYQVAQGVAVPLIGCGGISSADDALEFIMAGASAVQVGTATMVNPYALNDIVDGLEQFMEREGIESLNELIGAAL
jgi:dihydroorotate dehydrogenase (NAD+) catalytic subunit